MSEHLPYNDLHGPSSVTSTHCAIAAKLKTSDCPNYLPNRNTRDKVSVTSTELIPQYDGNETIGNNSYDSDVAVTDDTLPSNLGDDVEGDGNIEHQSIPVLLTSQRTKQTERMKRSQVLLNVVQSNTIAVSSSLPVIATSNLRSFKPRVNSVVEKIKNEDIDVLLVNEVWESAKNNHFQGEIKRIYEMEGLKYISCGARPSGKRGGGAGIIVNVKNFSLESLDVHVPNNLEVKWGLVRPKSQNEATKFREIIACSFYNPPNSKKQSKLLDHLIGTTHQLLVKHPKAAYVIGGDRNSMPLSTLIQALPKCKQVVTECTYKNKILDVLLMNNSEFYSNPQISLEMLPDNPRTHKPSDHKVPITRPISLTSSNQPREYNIRKYRPLPDSGKRDFLSWILQEKWEGILTDKSPSDQVDSLQGLLNEYVEKIFPEKSVRLSKRDQEFITSELKNLDRKKKREWRKHGRSNRYKVLQKEFKDKYKKAASDHLKKHVSDLKQSLPGRAYMTLKKMGAMPGDCEEPGTFTLGSHVRENLTNEDQLERISDYFVSISQEFPKLEIDQLSTQTRQKIDNIKQEDIPVIQVYEMYEILKSCRKKKSSVPGDLPPRLFNEDDVKLGLAEPAARIANNVAMTGEWPDQFKTEWGVVLQKEMHPDVEKQLRIISCTNQLSKALEKVVIKWLMFYVRDQLDPDQMGGKEGHSIAHYLIEVSNFILYNQDLSDPQAVMAISVDFSQGFNRIQHSILLEILSKMNVPGWLLRIMVSYLTQRKLRVRYKGLVSEEKHMFAGAGQGCLLGLWCFLFIVNFAGPKRNEKPLGETITERKNMRKPMPAMKKKWIDDLSILTTVNLKKDAVKELDTNNARPLQYHNRTGHTLPPECNQLQDEVVKLQKYAVDHCMKINKEKTKVAIFNPLKTVDIMPQISLNGDQEYIEVVEKYKLLGQILTTDMKTMSNTQYICQKSYGRMWILRRLKELGCPIPELLDVLRQQILSLVELAVPYWGPMITKVESDMIERILKTGLHIILQERYISFHHALNTTNMKSLSDRRKDIIFKFSKNAHKSDTFCSWFAKSEVTRPARSNKPLLKPVTCRTTRYSRSSLPVITQVASWHPPKIYVAPKVY